MSKKKIIAIVTVIVLLLAAGISVGVFLYGRGETQATDGNQVVDGNVSTDGTQTGENTPNSEDGDNKIIPPDGENVGEAGDNETVENQNAGNTGITTDTNVNNVGETTVTRVEEKDKLVSKNFFDWWKPMLVKINEKTALGVNEPQLTVEKVAEIATGSSDFAYVGQEITYVITVTNSGNAPVENIEITDKIPANTTFVSIQDAKISDEVVGTKKIVENEHGVAGVKWTVSIPTNKEVVAKFTVKVVTTEGTITNTAIANGQESKDPTNDEDEGNQTKISVIKTNKSSVITRNDQKVEIAKVNDLITYTITVENTGDAEGTIEIKDDVPAGTKLVAIQGTTISENQNSVKWSVTVPAHQKVTREFTVMVTSVEEEIKNTAKVGNTATNTDTVKVEARIEFVENGGSIVEDMTGAKGDVIANRTMPTTARTGYDFKGWYADATLQNKVDQLPEAYPAGTTIYYAKWEPRTDTQYKIEYYYQVDGVYAGTATSTDTKTGTTDTTVTIPEGERVPQEGYAGYVYDWAAGNVVSGTITSGEEKLVLKLYFKPQFTVTYTDGVEEVVFEDKTTSGLDYGVKTPEFGTDPTRAGYTFAGWNSELAETVTGNATYVAQWTPRTDTEYKIEYYYQVDGAYSGTATDSVKREGTTDTEVSVTDVDKTPAEGFTGYVYDTAAANVESGVVVGNGTLVLKLYFKQQFTVTYTDGVNGAAFANQATPNIDHGTTTPAFVGTPTRAGYEFAGWTPAVETTVTENATYTATWTANTNTEYKVEYYYQVDGLYPETATSSVKREETTDTEVSVTDADKTPAEGYTGYVYDTAAANVESGVVAGNGSLVLKLYFKQQFTVTYIDGVNGAAFANQTTPSIDYGTITPAFNGATSRVGYEFAGWTPAVATTVTGNATYIATWTANVNTKYTVEYYYQEDGEYPETATDSVKREGTTDTEVSVTDADKTPAEGFTGYVYDTAAANVESGVVAGNGTLVLKLYFKQQFTVIYTDGVEGEIVFANKVTPELDYGTATPAFGIEPTRIGYTFAGWNPAVVATVKGNATYTAQWTPKTDTEYKVEYYYQVNGLYPETATSTVTKTGTTDATITISEEERVPQEGYTGYVYDGTAGNIVTGKITAGEEKLVLKLYFKQQFTVTYTDGVEGEIVFADVTTSELDYGVPTPAFERIPVRKGYVFAGWNTEVAATVTADAIYVAQWTPRNDTTYVVEHYQQNLDGKTYTKVDTDNKTGTTGTPAEYEAKTYTGFTYKAEKTIPQNEEDRMISANGGLVIKLYYDRNTYNYTIKYYFNMIEDTSKTENEPATYGQQIKDEVNDYSNDEWTFIEEQSTSIPYTITESENLIEMFYGKSDISVEKTSTVVAQDGSIIINDNTKNQITYTIKATNNGYYQGTVTIADTKPQGTVLVSEITATGYSTNPTEEDLAKGITLTVPARETAQIQFTVKVTEILPGVPVENTPIVNGEEDETNKVENMVEKTINVKSKAETIKGTNIVIVIDLSASMNDIINEVSKLEAAKDAAQAFISKIFENGANGTQVSLVTFNFSEEDKSRYSTETDPKYVGTKVFTYELDGVTKTVVTNQAEATAMNAEIEKIQLESNLGTNMMAGLNKAEEQLEELKNSNSSNENVIIFLGDGDPDEDQEDDISLKATEIKNAGTEIYTIGFGLHQELDQFCCYSTWFGILVPFECTLENPIPKDQHSTLTTIFGNIHHHKTTVYEEEAIRILRNMASGETEAEKDKYAKSSTDANTLISTFNAISKDIAETDGPMTSESGLIELTGVYADDAHPITITVDGTAQNPITSLPTDPTDTTGSIILVMDNGEAKYYLNLAKFAVGATVSVEYYAE